MHPGHDALAGIQLPAPGPVFRIQGGPPIDLNRCNQALTDTSTLRRK